MDTKQIFINFYNGASIVRKVDMKTNISKLMKDMDIENGYVMFNGKILNPKKLSINIILNTTIYYL